MSLFQLFGKEEKVKFIDVERITETHQFLRFLEMPNRGRRLEITPTKMKAFNLNVWATTDSLNSFLQLALLRRFLYYTDTLDSYSLPLVATTIGTKLHWWSHQIFFWSPSTKLKDVFLSLLITDEHWVFMLVWEENLGPSWSSKCIEYLLVSFSIVLFHCLFSLLDNQG